jgi:hypothetical protein
MSVLTECNALVAMAKNQRHAEDPVPWSSDEIRMLSDLVRQPPQSGSEMARFKYDEDWCVRAITASTTNPCVIDLELLHALSTRSLTLRCYSVRLSPDSPFEGIVDAYSIRLMEFAGAIGLDRFRDGDVVDDVAGLYSAIVSNPSRGPDVRVDELPLPGTAT